ncbi:HCNGP-like protein-domain-containing protein [Fennellomyces sp. T-0311]|nr:HCNGP-like protein-domain-containing protein [Fennellomyces sp. T-0311]
MLLQSVGLCSYYIGEFTDRKKSSLLEKEEKPRIDEPPAAVRQHLNRTDQAQRKLLLKPKPIPGVDNWGIPPEPETPCDPERLEKIVHFLQLRASGHKLNEHLQRNKAFRNPRIYAKLVEFIDLDETGSNFDKSQFDPQFPKEAYIDGILEQQRKYAEEKALAQQNRTNISFVPPQQQEQSAAMAAAMANVAKVASRITQQQKRPTGNAQYDERERKRTHRE